MKISSFALTVSLAAMALPAAANADVYTSAHFYSVQENRVPYGQVYDTSISSPDVAAYEGEFDGATAKTFVSLATGEMKAVTTSTAGPGHISGAIAFTSFTDYITIIGDLTNPITGHITAHIDGIILDPYSEGYGFRGDTLVQFGVSTLHNISSRNNGLSVGLSDRPDISGNCAPALGETYNTEYYFDCGGPLRDSAVYDLTFQIPFTVGGPGAFDYFQLQAVLRASSSGGGAAYFGNTASFGLTLPEGYGFTSASGLFLTAASPGAVPEPATWAMMIGGFGLVGGAMRARRKRRFPSSTPADQPWAA